MKTTTRKPTSRASKALAPTTERTPAAPPASEKRPTTRKPSKRERAEREAVHARTLESLSKLTSADERANLLSLMATGARGAFLAILGDALDVVTLRALNRFDEHHVSTVFEWKDLARDLTRLATRAWTA